MRPVWSGQISFGLINIPVRLYRAYEDKTINLDLLHKKDLSPIRYKKVCEKEDLSVSNEEIVRGYEYAKDSYVILSPEDLKRTEKSLKTINIIEFIKQQAVPEYYFESPYYLEPSKGAEKAYVLLREALKVSGKYGLSKFVLRDKEYLGLLIPYENLLLVNRIRYQDEIRKSASLNIPKEAEISKREVDMALSLINYLSGSFKPEEYKDEYRQDLIKIINQKAKNLPLPKKKEEEINEPTQDLMAKLEESLKQERQRTPSPISI